MPNLTTSNGYMASSCFSIEKLSFPKLISSNRFAYDCYALKEVYLPELTSINGDFCINTPSLQEIELPKLTQIKGNFLQKSGIKEFTFPDTLTVFSNPSGAFTNNRALERINLFEGWKFSGLNLTTCENLTRDSLVDMLSKLADVTAEANTYTLTLGTTNLAKLTEEEIAIGTNKGWTIA